MTDPDAFIRAQTAIARPELVPEIPLYLATEITPIWQATEAWLGAQGIEPPFWAFAWPGSQAMAPADPGYAVPCRGTPGAGLRRRLRPGRHRRGPRRRGQRRGGRDRPAGLAATRLNAALNDVAVATPEGDVVGAACRWDLILAGDVCYEAPMTRHILPWLRAMAAAGAEVWLADPGRAYVPRDGMAELARFDVPVTRELEDRDHRLVTICRLLG